MQRFRNIFFQLHFDVVMKKNLSTKELINFLSEISSGSELSKHEAFVFMIISHGNEKKEIVDSNENSVKIEDLTNVFNDIKCPQLKGKPRLFFMNCCRGNGENSENAIFLFDKNTKA